jgi:hypothetical protein
MFFVDVKKVKASLIANEEVDQYAERNAHTQTHCIDERIHLPPDNISARYLYIVSYHHWLV